MFKKNNAKEFVQIAIYFVFLPLWSFIQLFATCSANSLFLHVSLKNTYKPCKAKYTTHIWRVNVQKSVTQTIYLGKLPNEAFDFSIFDKSGKNKASDVAVSLCPCGRVLAREQVQVLENSGSWKVISRFTDLSALYSHTKPLMKSKKRKIIESTPLWKCMFQHTDWLTIAKGRQGVYQNSWSQTILLH